MIVNNSVFLCLFVGFLWFWFLFFFFSPEGKEKKFSKSSDSGPFPSKFDKFFF